MYLVSSRAIRLLPTPGTPVIDTRRGRLSRAVARTTSRSSRNSSSRPTNGASSWSVRPRPPRSATIRMARNAGTGATLPLSTWSPAGSKAMAEFAACSVCSPTRTVPGAATLWRRDAVLTMSPATRPWLVAPTVTAASPVRTPARAWMPGPERADAVDQVERGTDCAFGVVVVRDRRAPDGHDRVADELLDRATVAADDVLALFEIARQEIADGLGVAALGERREPDEIGEQDRDQTTFRDGHGCPGNGRGRRRCGTDGAVRGRRPARRAEAGSRDERVPAARAGWGHGRPAVRTEPGVGRGSLAARRADHPAQSTQSCRRACDAWLHDYAVSLYSHTSDDDDRGFRAGCSTRRVDARGPGRDHRGDRLRRRRAGPAAGAAPERRAGGSRRAAAAITIRSAASTATSGRSTWTSTPSCRPRTRSSSRSRTAPRRSSSPTSSPRARRSSTRAPTSACASRPTTRAGTASSIPAPTSSRTRSTVCPSSIATS